jgi:hypothetical protein
VGLTHTDEHAELRTRTIVVEVQAAASMLLDLTERLRVMVQARS